MEKSKRDNKIGVKPLGACLVSLMLIALALPTGCVSPGPVGQGTLNQYARTITGRGVQPRSSESGINTLLPLPNRKLPPLKIQKDPQTGKTLIDLSLEEALMRTLSNNLDIKIVSYDAAAARQKLIQEASEFDYTAFGSYAHQQQDNLVDTSMRGGKVRQDNYEAGIKQRFVTGAEWTLRHAWSRTHDDLLGRNFNPFYEPTVAFEMTQPLLRDAGVRLNLSNLRVARLSENISIAAFRQKVEEIVRDVTATYWALVQARREVKIQEHLLDITQETLNKVKARKDIDATSVQIKQAEAALESRRAALITTRKFVRDAQNHLARLLSDNQINLLEDYDLLPLTEPKTEDIKIDPSEQLLLALRNNPQLEQAKLSVDISDEGVYVARRQMLPRLDLKASAGLQGLGDNVDTAGDTLTSGDHPNYGAGISFEYPLGNRKRVAQFRISNYERLKAVTTMQTLADQIAEQIKERLNQLDTTNQEVRAQHAAVEASRLQLQALEDAEKAGAKLTPEALLVKLQAQESLAAAERAEVQAIVDYNTAIVDLAVATGTVLEMPRVKSSLENASSDPARAAGKRILDQTTAQK
jgi:outer membrane protein TolC